MSSRGATLIVLIIVGAAVGYGASELLPPESVGFNMGINYLEEYERLTQQQEALQAQVETLSGQIDAFQDDHEALDAEHGALTALYDTLTQEHVDLTEAYNETSQNYDDLLMQYQVITGMAPLKEREISDDVFLKEYAWIYNGETYTLSLEVPKDLYFFYKNRTRASTEDYSIYVTHPTDDEYITTVIDKLNQIAAEEGLDEAETVNLVITFVQSLPYTSDDVTTTFDEYPRYPLETLVDEGGDCEDTSILTSALLETMGINVVLLNIPDHMAVGVNADAIGSYWTYEDSKYYYLETTGQGWEIGVIPPEYQGSSAVVNPILPIPICTHEWTASQVGYKLTLVADIANVGTDEAKGLKLYVAFDARDGEVLNPKTSEFFDLAVEEETQIMLVTNVPKNIRTRIIVRILDAFDNVMDESFSEWYKTG